MELAVRMHGPGCEKDVKDALQGVEGIKSVAADHGVDTVLVETTLTSDRVKQLIEETGRQAVIRGLGSSEGTGHLGAAVAMVSGALAKGVIRMVQLDSETCVFEGTVDGLASRAHDIAIHEAGDLSAGCDSCGDVFDFNDGRESQNKYGDLGKVQVNDNGRAEFRMESSRVKVWDVIGRSLVLRELSSQQQSCTEDRVACGIIARSAGLFQNPKSFCACDGVSIWDERNVPAAGPERQKKSAQL